MIYLRKQCETGYTIVFDECKTYGEQVVEGNRASEQALHALLNRTASKKLDAVADAVNEGSDEEEDEALDPEPVLKAPLSMVLMCNALHSQASQRLRDTVKKKAMFTMTIMQTVSLQASDDVFTKWSLAHPVHANAIFQR